MPGSGPKLPDPGRRRARGLLLDENATSGATRGRALFKNPFSSAPKFRTPGGYAYAEAVGGLGPATPVSLARPSPTPTSPCLSAFI